MATCPACGYKLKPWDIKAECPKCGVNIPNYDWEARLEADAARSERTFASFRRSTANLKSGLFGSPLMITRFLCTFLPLATLVLPIFRLTVQLPFYAYTGKPTSILHLILAVVNGFDVKAFLTLLRSEIVGHELRLFTVGLALIALGMLTAVGNFFALIFGSIRLQYTVNYAFCIASALFYCAAAAVFAVSFSAMEQSAPDIYFGQLSFALFVGIALFLLNLFLNLKAAKQLRHGK
ncbi:MAG: hypothetical protein IJ766_08705 [Clostridia bacterium]|nr:hypothetical protein [Clostridia bacterium]